MAEDVPGVVIAALRERLGLDTAAAEAIVGGLRRADPSPPNLSGRGRGHDEALDLTSGPAFWVVPQLIPALRFVGASDRGWLITPVTGPPGTCQVSRRSVKRP